MLSRLRCRLRGHNWLFYRHPYDGVLRAVCERCDERRLG
jgi:hypothetical protein